MHALKYSKGFTLVEVAIVLVIVGLLLSGGINLMSASSETARYKESQSNLNEVKETMISYYSVNHFLPCPDTDGDGIENPPVHTGTCTDVRGFLPHVTLGVGGNGDAWGERIKYVVTDESTRFFTTQATACNYVRPAVSASTIRIQDLNTTATNFIGDFAAFALVSTAKNGRQTNAGMTGAFTNNGGCAGLNVREQENCDTDSVLRFGNQMTDGTTVTFDDVVVWVGDMQLISELRKSGFCTSAGGGGSGGGSSGVPIDPLTRTTTDFTANSGQSFSGNYENHDSANTSNAADKVTISGNLEKDINLQDGDNTLSVDGNAEKAITAGSGNDIVRVKHNVQDPINLGSGDDYLEVWGNTTGDGTINMGAGNDSVRIEGNANADIALGTGSNAIYVGGHVNADITATGGTATVYLRHYSSLSSVPSAIKGDAALTLKCYVSSAWVTCA